MRRAAPACVAVCLIFTACISAQTAEDVGPRRPQEDLGFQTVEVGTGAAYYCVFEGSTGSLVPTETDCGWRGSEFAAGYDSLEIYTSDVSKEGLTASFKRLCVQVGASGAFDGTPNGERLRASLLSELRAALARVQPSSAVPMDAVSVDFDVGDRANEPVISGTIFFEGGQTQIVLREVDKYELVGTYKVPLSHHHYATIEEAIEVRTVCSIVNAIFAEVEKGPLARVHERVASIDRGWTNYLEKGYSQYPWEALVNSAVTPKIFGKYSWDDPPNEQLVFLHPEFCTLIDTRAGGDQDTNTALLVNGLGYVRYFGSERSWFAGLSASACFSDAEPNVGYGAVLHIDLNGLGMRLPHLSVGAIWFDSAEGWGDPLVSVTADFLGLLRSGEARDRFFEALQ